MKDTVVCSRCPASLLPEEEICPSCGTEILCHWDPIWYKNPVTMISIGKSNYAVIASKVFLIVSIAHLLVIIYSSADEQLSIATRENRIAIFMFLMFFTYELWAFPNGWRTSIDRYAHEGKPNRTAWRTFGFLLDCFGYVWFSIVAWK
jgi:hypothetical protein